MAGYIGTIPVPQATQNREAFTATSNQTSFATLGYTPGFIDVYLNGVKLAAADYTATNGSDVVLASGAASGDILEVVAFSAFTVADQTFTGDTSVTNLAVTGTFTSRGIDDNADAVAITIDSSENVGIGISNPSAYYTNFNDLVLGSTSTHSGITIASGTSHDGTIAFADGTSGDAEYKGFIQYNHTNNAFGIGTNGVEAMRISSAGNVGIGTSSPSGSGLHIRKDTSATTNELLRLSNSAGSTTDGVKLVMEVANTSGNGGEIGTVRDGGSFNPYMYFSTSAGVGSSPSERMRIDSSGNVGIGLSSGIDGKLHVGGNTVIGSGSTTAFSSFTTGGLDVAVGSGTKAFQVWDDNSTSTPRFIVERSGNVGIGTSSPNIANFGKALTITDPAASDQIPAIELAYGSNTRGANIAVDNRTSVKALAITAVASDLSMTFGTNNTERMRLDSSGNLLVGKTSAGLSNVGFQVLPTGVVGITRSGSNPLDLNRLSSDGNLIEFNKDGSTVGTIGTSAGLLNIGSGDTGLLFAPASDVIIPSNPTNTANGGRDNVIDLGNTYNRFKDLYLSGGVYLGGTGSANKLDDYEEGTFDVALDSGHSGSITLNSSYKTGRYIKIGNTVTFTLHVRISAVSGHGGTLGLTGLPFASPNDHDYRFTFGPCVFFSFTGMTDGDYPVAYLSHNSSTILFALTNTNSIGNFPANRLTAGSEWYVTGTYQTT